MQASVCCTYTLKELCFLSPCLTCFLLVVPLWISEGGLCCKPVSESPSSSPCQTTGRSSQAVPPSTFGLFSLPPQLWPLGHLHVLQHWQSYLHACFTAARYNPRVSLGSRALTCASFKSRAQTFTSRLSSFTQLQVSLVRDKQIITLPLVPPLAQIYPCRDTVLCHFTQ